MQVWESTPGFGDKPFLDTLWTSIDEVRGTAAALYLWGRGEHRRQASVVRGFWCTSPQLDGASSPRCCFMSALAIGTRSALSPTAKGRVICQAAHVLLVQACVRVCSTNPPVHEADCVCTTVSSLYCPPLAHLVHLLLSVRAQLGTSIIFQPLHAPAGVLLCALLLQPGDDVSVSL